MIGGWDDGEARGGESMDTGLHAVHWMHAMYC
jgi:hypothetical protein